MFHRDRPRPVGHVWDCEDIIEVCLATSPERAPGSKGNQGKRKEARDAGTGIQVGFGPRDRGQPSFSGPR